MIVTGLDFETTGTDPKVDRVIEIGVSTFEMGGGSRPRLLFSESALVRPDSPFTIRKEAFDAHGISADMLETSAAKPCLNAFRDLIDDLEFADVVVAFRAEFEQSMLAAELGRIAGLQAIGKTLLQKLFWVDACTDIQWPAKVKGRQLNHVGADLGLINLFPHRAGPDSLFMMTVVGTQDWDAVMSRLSEPQCLVRAHVDFGRNQLAKERGYLWDGKIWWKRVPEAMVDQEREAPFQVSVVERIPGRTPRERGLL
jgi:hypothetical protein